MKLEKVPEILLQKIPLQKQTTIEIDEFKNTIERLITTRT